MKIRVLACLWPVVTAAPGLVMPSAVLPASAIFFLTAVFAPSPVLAAEAGRAATPGPVPPVVAESAPRPHPQAARRPGEGAKPRICFNPGETRDKILRHGLGEPFRLLRGAAGHIQGEALRVKLCRIDEDYVYDISVLRRDGRLVHVFLNAVNGQVAGALNDR